MLKLTLAALYFCIFNMMLPNQIFAQDSQSKRERRDTLCQETKSMGDTYFEMWKKLFKEKNNMTQSYFDTHVSVVDHKFNCHWVGGIIFVAHYRVTYDWAVIDEFDHFPVLVYDGISYSDRQYLAELPLRRNQPFDEEEVSVVARMDIPQTQLQKMRSLEKLGFTNRESSLDAFKDKLGAKNLRDVYIKFLPKHFRKESQETGYPYLIGKGIIDSDNNICTEGYMNLSTGEAVVQKSICVMDY